jgi:hypothetical protein
MIWGSDVVDIDADEFCVARTQGENQSNRSISTSRKLKQKALDITLFFAALIISFWVLFVGTCCFWYCQFDGTESCRTLRLRRYGTFENEAEASPEEYAWEESWRMWCCCVTRSPEINRGFKEIGRKLLSILILRLTKHLLKLCPIIFIYFPAFISRFRRFGNMLVR